MSLAERVLRLVVRLAPADFRERYGPELLETYRARAARAAVRGTLASLRLAAVEVLGAIRLLARLRAAPTPRGRNQPRERRGGALDGLWQDVRLAGRGIHRNRTYAAGALVVLAVGIGANTAMFSAANAFFFRPLPFADEDRLVMLYETNPEFDWTDAQAAPANVLDWRERVDAFADVAAYSEFLAQVPHMLDGEPVLVGATLVTGNFFSVLGVPALLGRTFRWEETWAGAADVAVISHDLWTSHFGADPDVIGRSVTFGTATVELIGVMPAGFRFPADGTQMWTPHGWAPDAVQAVWFRRAHWLRPVARLVPGVTRAQADAEFQAVVRQLQTDYPETNRVMGAGMMPLRDFLIRDVRRPLLILLGAVGFLLLLACANVANLTLVRASERSREVAVRHALGAGRVRIARQLITESVVLALVGGVLGLMLGWAGVRGMQRLAPLGIEGATALALDSRVLLFTTCAAALSGLLFGMIPALRATGRGMYGTLTEQGRGSSRSARSGRTAGVLVAAEVALALLLVVGAGLMIQSFRQIREVDPGFRSDGVIAVQFTVPATRYPNRDEVLAFQDRFIEMMEGRPGVERAGVVGHLPLDGPGWSSQFQARGWPADRVGLNILHRRADRGYFEALDIPLVRGRLFESGDVADGPFVVVINATFAREHFPGEDPIGQRIAYDRAATEESTWYEIIGVVGDQHQVSPAQAARAEVFENRRQDWNRTGWVVVRTSQAPGSIVPTIREVLREIDPLVPIAQTQPLRDVWSRSTAREQFVLTLLTIFGAAALLLAAVGVYAVTAQTARRRTREIGIRMALGAVGADVVRLMVLQSLAVIGIGIVAGLGLTLALTRTLGSLLFGVAPTDPLTLAVVVTVLATVAGLACYLPARRATRVDPAGVLRED